MSDHITTTGLALAQLPQRLRRGGQLRLRLFSAAAQLVNTGRRHGLRFTTRWPWTDVITQAIAPLQALPNPD